ncbi:putative reverse transcriptase domain-containing protein, partial [Tanacetum coccineum]
RWHAARRITDGELRHPADSQAWRTIDEKFPEIGKDTRNLRLGISDDGVDVNTGNRHHDDIYHITIRSESKRRHLMTGEQIYNEVKHIENKWGKGKRTNNNALENQEDTRGRGGKIQKQKRNTTEEEGSSSQVNKQNDVYWKKFNIWYQKLKYLRHNHVPHCIDFMHVEKNVAESIVRTLLHVPGKTKDGLNARNLIVGFIDRFAHLGYHNIDHAAE